jgi:hypothetical protein
MYKDVVDDVKEKGYAAISHVWGNQEFYQANKLGIKNGIGWEIPLSNANKIYRMVNIANHYEIKYVWFDVLCMPQDKQDEINLEIPFMGDYYKGSHITFVLSDIEYIITEDFTKWSNMMDDIMKQDRKFTHDESKWLYSYKKNDILDLSEEIWLTRLWTFQEAILSKVVMLVDIKDVHLNLFDITTKISYLTDLNIEHADSLFYSDDLPDLATAMETYRYKEFRLIDSSSQRDCYKSQDKYYGALGILGYKDFPVDYNINIDDLNKSIVRHAYSKGDISWIGLNGDINKGFIQPLHQRYGSLGSLWEEDEPESCGIIFQDDTLSIDVFPFATITCCEKYDISDEASKFNMWIVRKFEDWGFNLSDIARVLSQYTNMSDKAHKALLAYLNDVEIFTYEEIVTYATKLFEDNEGREYVSEMLASIGNLSLIDEAMTLATATSLDTNKAIPLIISGNANIGDEVKLIRVHDWENRSLGIICKSDQRNGIFLYERIDINKDLYKPHKFVL